MMPVFSLMGRLAFTKSFNLKRSRFHFVKRPILLILKPGMLSVKNIYNWYVHLYTIYYAQFSTIYYIYILLRSVSREHSPKAERVCVSLSLVLSLSSHRRVMCSLMNYSRSEIRV